jgi:predicted regulator of Ras-like GTPase activity (Roadblock/LC7/MglB family)
MRSNAATSPSTNKCGAPRSVPFREILLDALQSTGGAIGAVFLDSEGESVEVVSARPFDTDDHALRVIGAYAGIFISKLRRITESTDGGDVRRYKIDFDACGIFCCDLKDGYYLVLVVDAGAVEGIVWQRLERCRDVLLGEM